MTTPPVWLAQPTRSSRRVPTSTTSARPADRRDIGGRLPEAEKAVYQTRTACLRARRSAREAPFDPRLDEAPDRRQQQEPQSAGEEKLEGVEAGRAVGVDLLKGHE